MVYLDQDTVSFTSNKGFKTTFAYFCEFENNNVSADALKRHLYIAVNLGSFSYAAMSQPTLYQHMLGVSGTLSTLSKTENKMLIKVYGINKRIVICICH